MAGDGLQRLVEGMGHQRLGVLLEAVVGDRRRCRSRPRTPCPPGEDHAAGLDAASSCGIASAIASSSSWSSALRASGRVEGQAGDRLGRTVEDELPARQLLAHRTTRGRRGRRPRRRTGPPRTDLRHLAVVLGLDRHLHLHRLEDDDGVAIGDVVADLDLDLPDGAGDVRLDVRHGGAQYPPDDAGQTPPVVRDRRRAQRGRPDRRDARLARGGDAGRQALRGRRRLRGRHRRGRDAARRHGRHAADAPTARAATSPRPPRRRCPGSRARPVGPALRRRPRRVRGGARGSGRGRRARRVRPRRRSLRPPRGRWASDSRSATPAPDRGALRLPGRGPDLGPAGDARQRAARAAARSPTGSAWSWA